MNMFNPVVKFRIKKVCFESVDEKYNSKLLKTALNNRIYEAVTGEGNPSIYVVCRPDFALFNGPNRLPLERIDEVEQLGLHQKFVKAVCKTFGEEKNADIGKLQELHDRHNLFFRPTRFINEKEFRKFKKLPKKEIDGYVEQYMRENFHVDDAMIWLYKSYLVRFSRDSDNWSKMMPMQAHSMVFTNSGVGKSSLMDKVGHRVDDATIARLLGFSTADSVVTGELDGKDEPVGLDEVQETLGEGLYRKLLSYEEIGEAVVWKGKSKLMTKGNSPIIYMSNPRFRVTGSELVEMFVKMCTTVTTNPEAFMRRKAIIFFSTELDAVEGSNLPNLDKIGMVVKEMFEDCRQPVTKAFFSRLIYDWMTTPHMRKYLNIFDSFIKNTGDTYVEAMIYGMKKNHRHVKGLAFRMAVVDYLKKFLNRRFNSEEFLPICKRHYVRIMDINVQSMKHIIDNISFFNESLIASQLEDLKPKSLRAFCYLVGMQEQLNDMYSFDLLALNLDFIDKGEFKSYARSFNEIEKRLKPSVETDVYFGFRIDMKRRCAIVTNSAKFEIFHRYIGEMTKSDTSTESIKNFTVPGASKTSITSKTSTKKAPLERQQNDNRSQSDTGALRRQNRRNRRNRRTGERENIDAPDKPLTPENSILAFSDPKKRKIVSTRCASKRHSVAHIVDVNLHKNSVRQKLLDLETEFPKISEFSETSILTFIFAPELEFALKNGMVSEIRKGVYVINL